MNNLAVPPSWNITKRSILYETGNNISLTADQWGHWTCMYSLYVLHGILPAKHFQCWLHFVKSCRLLCQKNITRTECELAHVNFCKYFELLCLFHVGRHNFTSNAHAFHVTPVLPVITIVGQFSYAGSSSRLHIYSSIHNEALCFTPLELDFLS